MLIKSISERMQIPVFEIMKWPSSELYLQAAFISFDICDDATPSLLEQQENMSVSDSIAQMKMELKK